MSMYLFIVASVFGMVGGALLQYVFGLRAERKRNVLMRRTEAYVDLIRAISGLVATAGAPESEAAGQARMAYGEARTRIAIYGSEAVISHLARVIREQPDFRGPEALATLTLVIKAMRTDGLGAVGQVADADIRRVVFDRD